MVNDIHHDLNEMVNSEQQAGEGTEKLVHEMLISG